MQPGVAKCTAMRELTKKVDHKVTKVGAINLKRYPLEGATSEIGQNWESMSQRNRYVLDVT